LWHSRCARSLRGRSFLRLLRPTSRGMCGAALWGIRDARAPCGDARFFASCDPPLVGVAESGQPRCGIGPAPMRNRARPDSESDQARFGIGPAPTRNRASPDSESDQAQFGIGPGPIRNRASPDSESGQAQFGIGPGPIRNRASPDSESGQPRFGIGPAPIRNRASPDSESGQPRFGIRPGPIRNRAKPDSESDQARFGIGPVPIRNRTSPEACAGPLFGAFEMPFLACASFLHRGARCLLPFSRLRAVISPAASMRAVISPAARKTCARRSFSGSRRCYSVWMRRAKNRTCPSAPSRKICAGPLARTCIGHTCFFLIGI